MRCFDYAAAAAPRPRRGHAARRGTRAPLLDRFRGEATQRLPRAYRAAHRAGAAALGRPEAARADLLDLFLLEKAAYEICYEAANRPAWLGIPLRGLRAIAPAC